MRNQEPPGTRLEGWKAIARYLGKDPRTALRWVDLGLPVCRVNGRNSSVYAYSDELEAWLRGRPPAGFDPTSPGLPQAAPAAQPAERDSRRAPPRDPAPTAVAAARPGDGTTRLPRDADEMLSLARAVAGHEIEPDTDPLVLAHALAAAWRSFIETLHAPASSAAARATRGQGAQGRAPSHSARSLPGLGARPAAVSRPRPPLG